MRRQDDGSVFLPQDVDLPDALLFGLSPKRLLYLVGGAGAAYAVWASASGLPGLLRYPAGGLAALAGLALAWWGTGGRGLDEWLVDLAGYTLRQWLSRRLTGSRLQTPGLIAGLSEHLSIRLGRVGRRPAAGMPGVHGAGCTDGTDDAIGATGPDSADTGEEPCGGTKRT